MQSMPLRSLAIMQCIQLVCTYVYIQYVFMCNCSFPASPLCVCRTDDVSSDFTLRGLSVQSIHGDRSAVDPRGCVNHCVLCCSAGNSMTENRLWMISRQVYTVLCKFLLFGVVGVL